MGNVRPRYLVVAAVLSGLGYLGNYFDVPIAFGVSFIFGSIFTIITVVVLGLGWGIVSSLIAASYTLFLWQHPYAIVIFTLEVAWIGIALRRGYQNIILIDSLYWLALGVWLVVLFYGGILHVGAKSVGMIALKQSLNGISNALIASILLSHTRIFSLLNPYKPRPLPSFALILFEIASLFLILPSILLMTMSIHRELNTAEKRITKDMFAEANGAEGVLAKWIRSHVNAARMVAALGNRYPLRPSDALQREVAQINALFPDYHNMFLGDAQGRTVAFDPPVNERGESTIGIGFSDRAWFKQLRSTRETVISDVFVGRGGVFVPIFSISVPVVRNGRLAYFGLGAVNLNKVQELFQGISKYADFIYTIIDRNGNVVISTAPSRKPLSKYVEPSAGKVSEVRPKIYLWTPGSNLSVAAMSTWKDAYYFMKLPIRGAPWTLLVESPIAPLQASIYEASLRALMFVAMLYGMLLVIATFISRILARPQSELALASKNIPGQVEEGREIVWPQPNIAEMKGLMMNMQEITDALRSKIMEVRNTNEVLEAKVIERTEDLKQQQRRLADIIEGTHVGTWEWNIQTGETLFNELWANIIGYRLEELQPVSVQTWIDHAHPDDLKLSGELLEKHFNGTLPYYECECRMRHKNGTWVWVLDRGKLVSRSADGKPLMMSGTHTDITERKRSEEKIKQSEQFIRNILDTVDEGFIVVDRDYRIQIANRAYCEQTSCSMDDIAGKNCFAVSHKTNRPCFEVGQECAVRKVFEDGAPHTVVHKHVEPDGSSLFVETKAFPMKDSSGAVTSAIEVITNITEKHLLEEERLKTQKLEAVGTLAGGIAHDFNNLLQGVFGYISLAKLKQDDKEKAAEALEQAEKALQMTVRLTNQLLTFSKGGNPVKKTIDIPLVIENAARFALSGSRSDFRLSSENGLWMIDADEGQISQVVQNIVLNADQAMLEAGMVEITLKNVQAPGSEIPTDLKQGKYVEISIEDSGIGIPEKYLHKIFDPYFTTKDKGSGLGLATSYSIIKNHNGEIDVQSEPGKGAKFRIYLPAISALEAEREPVRSIKKTARRGRILVMDDEGYILKIAREMLIALGHEADVVTNGTEAVSIYQKAKNEGKPFDIAILDMTIRGGIGGAETLKKLLELDPTAKAVVSSGYSDDTAMASYEKQGFKAVLRKPYNIDELSNVLDMLLST